MHDIDNCGGDDGGNPSGVGNHCAKDADCATNACANEASIWAGFADRGLGFGIPAWKVDGMDALAVHAAMTGRVA